jgi:hypothetical protein
MWWAGSTRSDWRKVGWKVADEQRRVGDSYS